MTFEEAKKILEDKGYCLRKMVSIPYTQSDYFIGNDLYEAVREVNMKDYLVCYYNTNPALNDSAKQFNDALLDEQAKKIKELVSKNKKLNDIIASRNNEICELQEKVKKVKELGKQIAHLNEVIGKKNAQLKDYKIACEEHDEQLKDYMLSDKNKDDMISGLKKLNEGLRHQLANATISKVNEQALKSAESALVYKDKVINRLKKTISDAVDILEKKDDRVYHIDPENITDDWFTKAAMSFFHITK